MVLVFLRLHLVAWVQVQSESELNEVKICQGSMIGSITNGREAQKS